MVDARRISPLADRARIEAPDGVASLTELPHLGKLVLRADGTAAARAVKKALGAELPTEPNTSSRSKEALMLWLGPDEWMLVTEPGREEALLDQLKDALSETHNQLVDVSDQHTNIELSGARAREMLMKLTTLDLHPRSIGPGDVAGTNFGSVTATLFVTNDGAKHETQRFQLIVRRSFADYLWCLLAEAGREFGLPEQQPRSGETMRP